MFIYININLSKSYVMKKSDFTLKDDVELYLTNFFNVSRYKELTESPVIKNLFDPPPYFFQSFLAHSLFNLTQQRKPFKGTQLPFKP